MTIIRDSFAQYSCKSYNLDLNPFLKKEEIQDNIFTIK